MLGKVGSSVAGSQSAMEREVFIFGNAGQIVWLIVRRIEVTMMDVRALRNCPVEVRPNDTVQSLAMMLKVDTAPVIADAQELLDRGADDNDHDGRIISPYRREPKGINPSFSTHTGWFGVPVSIEPSDRRTRITDRSPLVNTAVTGRYPSLVNTRSPIRTRSIRTRPRCVAIRVEAMKQLSGA
jgi:hypothetical protein